MPSITLNVPTATASRVLNAICTRYGYTGFLADGVTAQAQIDFVKAWIITHVMNAVREQEANTAAAAAQATAAANVDTQIIIT